MSSKSYFDTLNRSYYRSQYVRYYRSQYVSYSYKKSCQSDNGSHLKILQLPWEKWTIKFSLLIDWFELDTYWYLNNLIFNVNDMHVVTYKWSVKLGYRPLLLGGCVRNDVYIVARLKDINKSVQKKLSGLQNENLQQQQQQKTFLPKKNSNFWPLVTQYQRVRLIYQKSLNFSR